MTRTTDQKMRGDMRHNEMMSAYTTWRVGGPARNFYRPADIDDLAQFLSQLNSEEAIYFVGLGSNLLVRDRGINGTVISTKGTMDEIRIESENRVYVESGVSCARVARFCAREGLKGAEFLCGIPGTFGGALAMNAGCFGGETWEIVESVRTVSLKGKIKKRSPEEFDVSYRHVEGVYDEWFVSAILKLNPGDSEQLLKHNKKLLEERGTKQPTQLPNAGSVFKNPEGDYAARLIEAAGLKGKRIGGAEVSEKHANFIVNRGDATATDIETLISQVKVIVKNQFDIELQTEVKIIGERGDSNETHH